MASKVEDLLQEFPIIEAEVAGEIWQFDPVGRVLRRWRAEREACGGWFELTTVFPAEAKKRFEALWRSPGRLVPRAESDSSPETRGPVPRGNS